MSTGWLKRAGLRLKPLDRTLDLKGRPEGLLPVAESVTLDPFLNLERETAYLKTVEVPSFRVWRSTDSVVLGRFLEADREVHTAVAAELGVPVLRRPSGGGAVFHDPGNVNYSIYLPPGCAPGSGIEESLMALSFPVIELLERFGIPWSWEPPNNIYVSGGKISGSAQARSGGRLLHHGTLLVAADLDKMRRLLKAGGRSRVAPVANLDGVIAGMTVEEAERQLYSSLAAGISRSHLEKERDAKKHRQEERKKCLSTATR